MSTNQKMHSSQIKPMMLSTTDLDNIMNMAEASIKSGEFCHHMFGNENVVQLRAIASDMQARCEREIARQSLLAQERQAEEIEKIEKAKAEKKSATPSAPVAEPAKV